MQQAITAILLADAGVAGLAAARIYPNGYPQGAVRPAVAVHTAALQPLYDDGGEANLDRARFQIDCQAATFGAAKALAVAVRGALSNYAGEIGGHNVQLVTLEDERDFRESGSNAAEYLHTVQMDFTAWAAKL